MFRGRVLTRDEFPESVRKGKDLSVAVASDGSLPGSSLASSAASAAYVPMRLERALLFDDKLSNFRPQRFQNGIGVRAYTSKRVEQIIGNNSVDGMDVDESSWNVYFQEVGEMMRLVGIAYLGLIHWSGDVREVVGWVRGEKREGGE